MDAPEPIRLAVADPEWFPHQLDLVGRRLLFVRLPEADVRGAEFLDERVLQQKRDGFWAPMRDVLAHAGAVPARTVHAIFHIGHCGSTLVANLLEALPGVAALREPLPIRTLAESYGERELATAWLDTAQWQAHFDGALRLFARGQHSHTVLKATSSCNGLIGPWLARDADAKAMLLSIGLERYLATMLKSPASRLDAARFAPARLQFLHRYTGDDSQRLQGLADAELVALGWVAERARFDAAVAQHGARCRAVDFDRLLADGADGLVAIAAHFGLPHDAEAIARAWSPAVLGRYAKARTHAYGADDREADLAESRRRHGAEIAAGLAYADRWRAQYEKLARTTEVL